MNKAILIATFATAILPLAANANLLVNGDFEAHDALSNGSWGQFTDIPGWHANADMIEIGHSDVYGIVGNSSDVMEMDANHNATVTQSVGLAAGDYQLSLDYFQRAGIAPGSCQFQVVWNGSSLGTWTADSTSAQNLNLSVSALDGTNTLSLVGAGTDDSVGALIDNVNLQAVPEPASVAAFAVGLVGLIRRRKSA